MPRFRFLRKKSKKRNKKKEENLTFFFPGQKNLHQLFAGHETTGTTIARLLRELYSRPELVRRLREEQAEIVAEFGTSLPESHGQDAFDRRDRQRDAAGVANRPRGVPERAKGPGSEDARREELPRAGRVRAVASPPPLSTGSPPPLPLQKN